MSCQLDPQTIDATIAFHGHSCPGLAIGMRAAEIALREMAGAGPADLVCVSETDMCGVDAIQFLTGCTYGKGNLLHRDYGKMAFSFHNRATGRAIRLLFNPEAWGAGRGEFTALMAKSGRPDCTAADRGRLATLRAELQEWLLRLPAEDVFFIRDCTEPLPRPARVLDSLVCADCGESTMESRTRRFGGRTLCIPCFARVEQKV